MPWCACIVSSISVLPVVSREMVAPPTGYVPAMCLSTRRSDRPLRRKAGRTSARRSCCAMLEHAERRSRNVLSGQSGRAVRNSRPALRGRPENYGIPNQQNIARKGGGGRQGKKRCEKAFTASATTAFGRRPTFFRPCSLQHRTARATRLRSTRFPTHARSLLRVDRHIAGTYPVGGATISRLTTGRTEMDETIQAHHGIVVRAARVVPARPEEVYRMFTAAALIPKWWGRTDKVVLLACETDARAGGLFRFALRTEKGAEDAVTGHYFEVSPPHKLAFSWTSEKPQDRIADTRVTVEFLDLMDGTTRVVVTHEGLPSPAASSIYSAGWHNMLQDMNLYLVGA